ncbi:hypothetical protein R1sor_022859 [Riccia sorocarpa]|uniref:DDE Tnp4 domain-containing protein n=1 Tax=Riccia sorocarpa TaxID=122646 RepID=A0ABD3GL35_9MARC
MVRAASCETRHRPLCIERFLVCSPRSSLHHSARAAIAEHFAALGFSGSVGLVDGTLVKLSQRPRDDGKTYFTCKSNYSLNVQVICDHNKRVIHFFRWDAWQLPRPDVPKAVRIVEASGLGLVVLPWTEFAWR